MSEIYEIHVQGHLDNRWKRWFEGMTLMTLDGETVLSGEVTDQAALYGILSRIRDLGLTLLLVKRTDKSNEINQ